MHRASRPNRQKRQVHRRFGQRRKLALERLGRLVHPLHRHLVARNVDARFVDEVIEQILLYDVVEVVSAQMVVARRRQNSERAVVTLQNRNVERAAAQIEDRNIAIRALHQTKRQRRKRRFVHNAQNFEPCQLARIARRLPLRIVKIRWHRYHALRHRFRTIRLRTLLQLRYYHRTDFLRAITRRIYLHPRITRRARNDVVRHHALELLNLRIRFTMPNQPLNPIYRTLRIDCRLPFRMHTYMSLAFRRKRNHRRRRALPLVVDDDYRIPILDYRDTRIRRSKVDSYNFAHLGS